MELMADMGERGSRRVKMAMAALFVLLIIILYCMLAEFMGNYAWLQVQCNVDLVEDFKVEVSSLGQAESLAGSVTTIESINQSKFQYCDGYAILSEESYYFLCKDGRLYELKSCY